MRLSKRPERKTTVVNEPVVPTPVDPTILKVLGQTSFDVYNAPLNSISGQVQNWSWQPRNIKNAQDNTWQANWNALPVVLRPYYGMALQGGVSKQLLREIYEKLEGHSPREGAYLVNVMTENGAYYRIENGQLIFLKKNSDGTMNRTVLANLAWPNAETKADLV